jgi:integrase
MKRHETRLNVSASFAYYVTQLLPREAGAVSVMPRVKFTAQWAKGVKPPVQGRVDYFDTTPIADGISFGLRVSRGAKTWFALYRHKGRLKRLTIGRYPKFGLKDAREKVRPALAKILEGGDPQGERRASAEAPTFEDIARTFIEKHAKPRKRSWQRDLEILDRDVIPEWKALKAHEIRRRDVIGLLENIAARPAPILANRALALIRKIFNWCIEREEVSPRLLDANPAAMVKPIGIENERDRILDHSEIRVVWGALSNSESRITEPVRLALKLMLVTAQRKSEVIGADWSEFDLSSRWWTIPSPRTKNGRAHRVPLSDLALELLSAAEKLPNASRYVFPSPRAISPPVAEPSSRKPILASAVDQAVRNNRDVFGVRHWTPHDLRRTAATEMSAAGIPRLVVAKILNHSDRGVTGIYDRHTYDAEKRHALTLWAERLRGLIASSGFLSGT